jgi:hypothetical protein
MVGARNGLHSETNAVLFGRPVANKPDEWWERAYAVTPKSRIIASIVQWVENPRAFPGNGTPIICSTDFQLTRRALRNLDVANAYLTQRTGVEHYAHGIPIHDSDVIVAVRKARTLHATGSE